ncbi:hypothetical protein ACIF8Z_12215 [Pseudomonas promysalinigenes]|uniref:hypothetical protein n=1 Tax=Pseudomonas promysalinigenes TaxID=485898 RepID=UPI0037C805E9
MVAEQALGKCIIDPRLECRAAGRGAGIERIAGPPVHFGQGDAQFSMLRPPEGVAGSAWCHRAGFGVKDTGTYQGAVTVDLLAQTFAPAAVRFGGEQVLFVQRLGFEVAHLQAQGLAFAQRESVVACQYLHAVANKRGSTERPIISLAPQARRSVAAGEFVVVGPAAGGDGLAGCGYVRGEVSQPLGGVQLASFGAVVDPYQFAGAPVYQAGAEHFIFGQRTPGLDGAQAVPATLDTAHPFQAKVLHVWQAAVG